jgi:hypothetical protein
MSTTWLAVILYQLFPQVEPCLRRSSACLCREMSLHLETRRDTDRRNVAKWLEPATGAACIEPSVITIAHVRIADLEGAGAAILAR